MKFEKAYHFIVVLTLLIMTILLVVICFDIKFVLTCSDNSIIGDSFINDYSSILCSVSTFVLGLITLYVQHGYQEETREDRRLSFQPFFYSFKKTILASEFDAYLKKENTINLSDYQPESFEDEKDASKTIYNSSFGKKYSFISYRIRNVGRDSAVNINLCFNDKTIYRFSNLNGEEEVFYICINPDKDKELKIAILFESLDANKYIQKETINFDDSFKNDETILGWEIVDSSFLSQPSSARKKFWRN